MMLTNSTIDDAEDFEYEDDEDFYEDDDPGWYYLGMDKTRRYYDDFPDDFSINEEDIWSEE